MVGNVCLDKLKISLFSDRQFGSVSNVLIVQQAICSPQQKKRKKKEKEEDK